MKNNNELKPLFRNADLIPNPLITDRENVCMVETKSLYNIINQTLPSMMVQEKPVDTMDIDIIRHNLCLMFENRVINLLSNTIKILQSRLYNLENRVRKFISENTIDNFYPYITIDIKDGFNTDTIVNGVIEKIPYITDLIFYFNINDEFVGIKTIALSVSTMVYNKLRFEIADEENILTNEEIKMINDVINIEFKKFTNSIIDDLHGLLQEARFIYHTSGDYNVNENGEITHYLAQENQAEFGTVETVPVVMGDSGEKRLVKLSQLLEDIF